jgi:hypothetical protein
MSLEHSPARAGRAAFTIAEFCEAHRISRSKLYQLINAGIGPRIIKIGQKRIISAEAAAAWRAEREAQSEQSAA